MAQDEKHLSSTSSYIGSAVILTIYVLICLWCCPSCCGCCSSTPQSRHRRSSSTTSTARTTASATTARITPSTATSASTAETSTTDTSASATAPSPSDVNLNPKSYKATPSFVYRSVCAVCLMEFKDGERGRLLMTCSHSFHAECIDIWLRSHSTCPLCRSTTDSQIHELPV